MKDDPTEQEALDEANEALSEQSEQGEDTPRSSSSSVSEPPDNAVEDDESFSSPSPSEITRRPSEDPKSGKGKDELAGVQGKEEDEKPLKEQKKQKKKRQPLSTMERYIKWWTHNIKYGPLLCAVVAPLSTLLAIPALTQPWFTFSGSTTADPGSSLALSAVSFTANALANLALIARFNVSERHWRGFTIASVVVWWIDVIVAVTNLALYGAYKHNGPGYDYAEGFWCAVASLCIAGLIALLLTFHFLLRYDRPSSSGALIRVHGAQFIFVVSAFVILIGIEGLIFSQVEHWTYFQGIYFAIISAFTIGLGDFEPTYTVTRILLFPFAVLSIAFLAVQVGVLVDFISDGAQERRNEWKKKYEHRYYKPPEADGDRQRALVEEIDALQHLERKEEKLEAIYSILMSSASLIVFWVIGGVCFMAIEGWAFGSAMYFTMVVFLTIGYGDYAPVTPGGRVLLFLYVFNAVPVVTNFVVTTVSGLLSSIASRRFQQARDKRAPQGGEKRKFHSHAHNVENSAKRLVEHFGKTKGNEAEIAKVLIGLAIRLEVQATTLLINTLPHSDKGEILLRADRNLQMRALEDLKDSPPPGFWSKGALALEEEVREETEEAEDVSKRYLNLEGGPDTLEQIRRYRETLGGLLAAGSMLMNLEGEERHRFERRLPGEEKGDLGGMLLGTGREGPAERETGLDV